jgi:hypothetical protein
MARVETKHGLAFAGCAVLAAVALLTSRADAGFDGLDVDSSTFANQYNGNDIFDGSAFSNPVGVGRRRHGARRRY